MDNKYFHLFDTLKSSTQLFYKVNRIHITCFKFIFSLLICWMRVSLYTQLKKQTDGVKKYGLVTFT